MAHIRRPKGRLPLLAYRGIYLCYTVLHYSSTPLDGARLPGGGATTRAAVCRLWCGNAPPFFVFSCKKKVNVAALARQGRIPAFPPGRPSCGQFFALRITGHLVFPPACSGCSQVYAHGNAGGNVGTSGQQEFHHPLNKTRKPDTTAAYSLPDNTHNPEYESNDPCPR